MPSFYQSSATQQAVLRTGILEEIGDEPQEEEQAHAREYLSGSLASGAAHRSLGGSFDASVVDSLLAHHARGLYEAISTLNRDLLFLSPRAALIDAQVHARGLHLDARSRLTSNLLISIERDPVEDGIIHAGEIVLGKAVAEYGIVALGWISELLVSSDSSNVISSVIKLIGRIGPVGSSEWRKSTIVNALSHDSLEVRDAAVQCIEDWEDTLMIGVLDAHQENDEWLSSYIDEVKQELAR